MGAKYEDQAGEQPAMAPPLPRLSTPGINVEIKSEGSSDPVFTGSSMAEFAFEQAIEGDAPAEAAPVKMPQAAAAPEAPQIRQVEIPRSISSSQIREYTGPVMEATAPPPPIEAAPSQEVDLSGEWEEMLVVEESSAEAPAEQAAHPGAASTEAVPELPVQQPTVEETPIAPAQLEVAPVVEPAARDQVQEAVEELRFYLEQKMVPEAETALARLKSSAPNHPAIHVLGDELRTLKKKQASEAATRTKPSTAAKKPAQPPPSEFS